MQFYYYIFVAIFLFIAILFVCHIILKRKNVPVRLFAEALKSENNGYLEEAVVTYKSALLEVKKIRFHSELKRKIIQKLKVLHTMIEYKKNSHFTR